jgi:sarcosine oxidase subunit alpha
MTAPDRRELVGVLAVDSGERLPYSAHLVRPGNEATVGASEGWITSLAYSPTLGHDVALALLERGRSRIGEELLAYAPIADKRVRVKLVAPHFYDPKGERQLA